MRHLIRHWTNAIQALVITVFAGYFLLPLIRTQPESLHKYMENFGCVPRIIFTLSICISFTGLMFKLLKPRLRHLAHVHKVPPTWLAVIVGVIFVALIDIYVGYGVSWGPHPVWRDWLCYGVVSFVIVSSVYAFLMYISGPELPQKNKRESRKCENGAGSEARTLTEPSPAGINWEHFKEWLDSDAPAKYDFLNTRSVAECVKLHVENGTRSIGIVGPFGAGKSTIVRWVQDGLNRGTGRSSKYFVCHHSCWGFESSSSSIHEMLRSAMSKINEEVDTFQLESLPESYRRTFAAGGNWLETISDLTLGSADSEQIFSHLSGLLDAIKGRLVFIIEDLDRNETNNFEIQEVLGFLERLKKLDNISFILTGGLTSPVRIDYSKLCDHIEFLTSLRPQQVYEILERVLKECEDDSILKIRPSDESRMPVGWPWNHNFTGILMDFEEFPIPQAVAALLKTPRSLRHAIGRTFHDWEVLRGEICFDHLLAVNIIRFGAPEAFLFLIRRWDRLRGLPNRNLPNADENQKRIRQGVSDDWTATIEKVDWNPKSASSLMNFILPACEFWLEGGEPSTNPATGLQRVYEERYWKRAITGSIESSEIRDQIVLRDMKNWFGERSFDSTLVINLTSDSEYANQWELLAPHAFTQYQHVIEDLFKQVIQRHLAVHGPSADANSQGFVQLWRYVEKHGPRDRSWLRWLKYRLSDAGEKSIGMVIAIWYYFCLTEGQRFVPEDAKGSIRSHIRETLRETVKDGPSLAFKLTMKRPFELTELIFDTLNKGEKYLTDLADWEWLAPHIRDGMKTENAAAVALHCARLLCHRGDRTASVTVDTEMLDNFFAGYGPEIIELITVNFSNFSVEDQAVAGHVITGGRVYFAQKAKEAANDEVRPDDGS
ncbi:P-loop NTPase fold protein [Planctomicrobium sp. SH668]|uniref:P-loop NTPase fold protein n=1 Tax=Planctomicrobium sp. SH668 TaxID=3448126 RepID=UPI003F5B4C7C